MFKQLAVSLVLGAAAQAATADEAPLSVTLPRLSLETALAIAQGAVESCRREGIQVAATVVDREGTVQVALRDTIAAPITVMISRQKAYTAVNFNAATSTLGERADTPIGRVSGLIMYPGGVPIQAGGALMGGIGVSGAPSGETDEACAKAGVDKVIEDLEMAM